MKKMQKHRMQYQTICREILRGMECGMLFFFTCLSAIYPENSTEKNKKTCVEGVDKTEARRKGGPKYNKKEGRNDIKGGEKDGSKDDKRQAAPEFFWHNWSGGAGVIPGKKLEFIIVDATGNTTGNATGRQGTSERGALSVAATGADTVADTAAANRTMTEKEKPWNVGLILQHGTVDGVGVVQCSMGAAAQSAAAKSTPAIETVIHPKTAESLSLPCADLPQAPVYFQYKICSKGRGLILRLSPGLCGYKNINLTLSIPQGVRIMAEGQNLTVHADNLNNNDLQINAGNVVVTGGGVIPCARVCAGFGRITLGGLCQKFVANIGTGTIQVDFIDMPLAIMENARRGSSGSKSATNGLGNKVAKGNLRNICQGGIFLRHPWSDSLEEGRRSEVVREGNNDTSGAPKDNATNKVIDKATEKATKKATGDAQNDIPEKEKKIKGRKTWARKKNSGWAYCCISAGCVKGFIRVPGPWAVGPFQPKYRKNKETVAEKGLIMKIHTANGHVDLKKRGVECEAVGRTVGRTVGEG